MKGGMRVVSLLVFATLMLFSMGCSWSLNLEDIDLGIEQVEVGETQEVSRVIELDDAEEVRVDIRMGAGKLNVDGGAASLLEADFTYNVDAWEPEVTYTDDRLTVRQPSVKRIPSNSDIEYRWDLKLNDDMPMDFRLEMGAGDGNLNLGSLSLTDLDMKLGAGDVEIDLTNNETLERLELDMGAGDLDLDLRGAWKDDVYVNIQGGVGKITVHVPEDLGVRVDVTKGIGAVNADGFRLADGDYVNDAYGDSDTELNIIIQAGIGEINLELD